jgi:hypothetical protein
MGSSFARPGDSSSLPTVAAPPAFHSANAFSKVGLAEGFDEANQIAVMTEKWFASKTRQTLQ